MKLKEILPRIGEMEVKEVGKGISKIICWWIIISIGIALLAILLLCSPGEMNNIILDLHNEEERRCPTPFGITICILAFLTYLIIILTCILKERKKK